MIHIASLPIMLDAALSQWLVPELSDASADIHGTPAVVPTASVGRLKAI
jgi:hypothetical protein